MFEFQNHHSFACFLGEGRLTEFHGFDFGLGCLGPMLHEPSCIRIRDPNVTEVQLLELAMPPVARKRLAQRLKRCNARTCAAQLIPPQRECCLKKKKTSRGSCDLDR